MRPADDDLDLRTLLADIEDEAADAFARVELLAWDLLGAGHERLGPVDGGDQSAALVALGGAGDDLTDASGELIEYGVPLVVAEFLDHDLFEGLGADAAKLCRGDL